ncbi:MAG TPA: EAL domain-containing protein [Gammaproteobacteria bacterium]|nr:EAL domain-containing protein [Gammaproteobacteria bacterium]
MKRVVSQHDGAGDFLRRGHGFAFCCALAATLLGIAAFAGWLIDEPFLTALNPAFIPMAPNTAVCFVMLGGALMLWTSGRKGFPARAFTLLAIAVTGVFALGRLSELLLGHDLDVDQWLLARASGTFGLAPVGRMSLFTALAFVAVSAGLLMTTVLRTSRLLRLAGALCAAGAFFLGASFLAGYLYGYPLFQHTPTIPMALNTASAFVLLSAGLLALFLGEEFASLRDERALLEARVAAHTQQLQESEARYRRLFMSNPQPMWIYDLETLRFLEVNDAAVLQYGYSREEFLAMTIADIRPPEDVPRLLDHLAKRQGDVLHSAGWRHRRKDGSLLDVEISSHTMKFEGRPARLVIVRDVTEHKKAQAVIERLANFDTVTGLANRNLFQRHLEGAAQRAREKGRPLALLFIDLDRFKEINDTLGHAFGDRLLKLVAARLATLVGEARHGLARLGGDEFAIILEDCADTAQIAAFAERLLGSFRDPFRLEARTLILGASIGISVYPTDTDNLNTLRSNADIAMYHAKAEGRNTFRFYAPAMHARARARLEMEHLLRGALERGEFTLVYQPVLRVDDGALVGAEALLRWHSPELGAVAPAEFVPLAEETGLILPIGDWVLREACAECRRWQDAGGSAAPWVAVNISASQFRQPDLATRLAAILRAADLPADKLELEITESVAMHDPEHMIEQLRALDRLGVRLAIDDFGTGYSNLAYLKRLPADKLKIDRSFVRDCTREPDDAAIVDIITRVAHNLGLRTLAEGVEHADQLAFLRERGCDEYQGFFAWRPMAPEKLRELLKQTPPLTADPRSRQAGAARE